MAREPFNPLKTAAMRDTLAERPAGGLLAGASAAPSAIASGSQGKPLTVRQVNALVNGLLTDALPPAFFIQGEISNFRTYDRGHAFFTLKEPGAELPCVLWKDALARLKFRPRDGMAVIARGAVKLYEPQGKLQLYVETLIPQGAGSLELAFRQLCEKLKAEGLFESCRKRPIPKLPQTVAIITSRTGDVLHDVLTTAYHRFPGLHTLLFPVRVQGDQAAADIAHAIHALNQYELKIENRKSKIDLILLVRGGGSLEDLWAFNEEIVARAICDSRIPIATGIGHEPDTTIADLVGDLRGPTPTGVTELTIPDVRTLRAAIDNHRAILTRDMRRLAEWSRATLTRAHSSFEIAFREALRNRMQRIDMLARSIERIEPRHAIAQGWRRIEECVRRLDRAMHARLAAQRDTLARTHHRLERCNPAPRLHRQRDRLDALAAALHAALRRRNAAANDRLTALARQLRIVSPQSVLDRGFSITTDAAGAIVRSAAQVKKGDLLTTRVADGAIVSTVGKPKQASLF
jgi:exodeoxyribonuclease VII large subunit